jgi:cactin
VQFRNETEDEQYKQWLAKEDDFMLTQTKKRAVIRVREGRARPIDVLVINLNLVEEGERRRVLGDDEIEGEEFYITDPDDIIKVPNSRGLCADFGGFKWQSDDGVDFRDRGVPHNGKIPS